MIAKMGNLGAFVGKGTAGNREQRCSTVQAPAQSQPVLAVEGGLDQPGKWPGRESQILAVKLRR
jgi:hypothetical protein